MRSTLAFSGFSVAILFCFVHDTNTQIHNNRNNNDIHRASDAKIKKSERMKAHGTRIPI